jgi:penicillin amidase
VSGTLAVSGLSSPVRIVRDRSGVPHIYAGNRDDLFFAQGFVQAQDRLFQMDLWRRAGQGRLAQILGPNFVARDVMSRRVQYRGNLDAEWASYGPDARAIATAFVAGINAWVTLARERPPEAFVLAGWLPEIWSPADLLNRTDAFAASGDAIDEVFRARLVAAVGATRVEALLPGEPALIAAPGLDLAFISPMIGDVIRRAGAPPFLVGLAAPVPPPPTQMPPVVGEQSSPTSAVDGAPGRTADHPSRRYLVHLEAPGWSVIGATAPWLPGVAIGHNQRVAWGAVPFDADTQDIYVEKVNPSNPHQVEDDGRWVDTTIVGDSVSVKGRPKPFTFEHEFTRHGPIVTSDKARNLAFVVRWSGTEPGAAPELAALSLDIARSSNEFDVALNRWRMPAREFRFEDVDGRSGSQVAALIPQRTPGSGALPVPGWNHDYDWSGWRSVGESFTGVTRSRPSSSRSTAARVLDRARADPQRVDELLRNLSAADSLKAQQRLIVEAIRQPATGDGSSVVNVTFAHPLAVTDAARARFNIGPISPHGDMPAFEIVSDLSDWDRTRAMNAPGQSESPLSEHFADLAKAWAAGTTIVLPFSQKAVDAATETTLMLIKR